MQVRRNLKYIGINLTIETNGKFIQESKELVRGRCIRVAFFPFGTPPSQNINLSVEDTQGNPILEAVDIRDYEKGTSGGLDSYKEVNFQTNGKVIINMFSPLELGRQFGGHLLFVIDTNAYDR
jgi:hypothetical protein